MKKFFVGLVSVLILFGATILTACGSNKVSLSLSTDTVAIQIKDDTVSNEQVVTATVSGTKDTEITASPFGYENIIDVRTEKSTNGRTLIYITGKDTEGHAEVVVRTHEGNTSKVISVDVYSEVSAMTQKVEETTKKSNFAIRGGEIELVDSKLLTFEPSENSRRTITWTLYNPNDSATIEGNTLTIDESFEADTIRLVATTEKGITCELELPVVDKLEENLVMGWSYSQDNQVYDTITEDNNTFNIVPNVADDEWYTGYIKLNATQGLDVSYYVLSSDGKTSDDLIINARRQDEQGIIFEIYANKNKTNINGDYVVYFEVGYSDYNYSVSTLGTMPINIKVREKVNGIIVSSDTSENIEDTIQVLYSEYSNAHGEEYNVQIIPTTVLDATRQYSISVRFTSIPPEGGLSNGCPVEFWYQDANNNYVWTQILLEYDDGQGIYTTRENNLVSTSQIYMKAASDLKVQAFEGIEVTFTSADNPNITNIFDVRVVKSVSLEDFVFEDADFKVDSSYSIEDVNITKTFTLKGQTTTDGLFIKNYSENVIISDPVKIDNLSTNDSVAFSITLTLKRSSFGITSLDSYQICHENGLESEEFDIDIFLPLKEAVVMYDSGNATNSVTNFKTNNLSYDPAGNQITTQTSSLSRIMVKNGTTTPLLYSYNSSGSHFAVADLSISFYDFVESETMNLDTFKGLINSQAGIAEIINKAYANENKTSDIVYFSADNKNIISKSVGYTYAVFTFTGKGTEDTADENGNVTIIRIVMIESYISPDGMNFYPLSDRQVNLYASDTVSTRDASLTRKKITINFNNSDITYKSIGNFKFVSTAKDAYGNNKMTDQVVIGNAIRWENGGRYTIENISITDYSLSFDIVTNTNFGEYSFYDQLDIHYQLIIEDGDQEKVIDVMWTTLDITIRNAQRLTSVEWENYDEDGIYFEVGDQEPYYLLLTTAPSNARNNNISYLITDENGTVLENDSFVGVDDEVSENMLGLQLSDKIEKGTSGYIYLLPEDAVYNGNIIYSYADSSTGEEVVHQSQISVNSLGSLKDGTSITWYDYLTSEAFFISNASLSDGDGVRVNFSDILLKIKITVADGSSFDYAYRIYDENGFNNINPTLYYTVMNSLEISSTRTAIDVFSGGLQGYNDSITIKLNGANFANELASSGEIRNIIFSGEVTAQGFVVNTNNGILNNVSVDVYGTYSSKLTHVGAGYVGGLAGVNNNIIKDSSVLGLTINATEAVVGGITGQNIGTINNSKVEFYNLSTSDGASAINKFSGATVGGLVGQAEDGSIIDHAYAYNYNIDAYMTDYSGNAKPINVLDSAKYGLFIGQRNGQVKLYYSFAVLGNQSIILGGQDGEFTSDSDYYYSYINSGSYTTTFSNESSGNLINSGEGFYEYVNGGKAHFRDFYQEEKVTNVNNLYITKFVENGYYKSLNVGTDQNYGILFNYQIEESPNDLSDSAINDLNELNTISIAELLGIDVTNNLIATSSNNSILKVIGSSISIQNTGDVEIKLSSKHDVTNNKTFTIKVIYAMSQMIISWQDNSGSSNIVNSGSTTYLQKTKSRLYAFSYEKPTVVLGNDATIYNLIQNDIDLQGTATPVDGQGNTVYLEKTNANSYRVTANKDSVESELNFTPVVLESEYQDAINTEFSKHFTVIPSDGVISFSYTGESLPLTPSTNAALKVEVNTTAKDDNKNLIPRIEFNGEELEVVKDAENDEFTTTYNYLLPQDRGTTNYILTSIVTITNPNVVADSTTGIYNYIFEVTFAVYSNYKTQVDEDMDFIVSFISNSGNDSKVTSSGNSGTVLMQLTKQKFNNVDVNNYKITRSVWGIDDNNKYVTVHTKGDQTGVLAPGASSIMQITVNPAYAHYDYMTVTYSGATVSNAVNFELLEMKGDNAKEFIPNTDADYTISSDNIRYVPTAEEKLSGSIYLRVAISSAVNSDSTIKFTAAFYESEGQHITSVNYFLSINYLNEPIVTIDGSDTAYVALGSATEIKIQVLEDQTVDNVILDGENLEGIYISSLSEPVVDTATGIKTYTATLNTSVKASVGAENNAFYIQARVSRVLNGVEEIKTTSATAILVDFKLDNSNINIKNSENGNLNVWLGVEKPFDVEYNVLPETYNYDQNDQTSVEKVQELTEKRNNFLTDQLYLSKKEDSDIVQYAINYRYDEINGLQACSLEERLFYVVGNESIPVTDNYADTAAVKFSFSDDGKDAVIVGTRMGSPVQFKLETYVTAGNITSTYSTYFTVNVEAYSDPDLPLTISNATDFKNLDPSLYESTETLSANDYILTNDIVLENYKPFNTSLIRSLDGNGYTIYLKSFDMSSSSGALNLSLFNEVLESTTLKNVRVNIYNGGQLTIDLASLSNSVEINIAGLAITNEGIITNSEVVAFYSSESAVGDTVGGVDMYVKACTEHSQPLGFNVSFIRGANTEDKVFITEGSTWVPSIAGFVLNNNGSITNSRVGGTSIVVLGDEKEITEDGRQVPSGYTYASTLELEVFNIIGQGDMSGFVLSNSGSISASFVKQLDMTNQSNTTSFDTSGFAGLNSGSIITSYVEGKETSSELIDEMNYTVYAFEGSSLKSNLGCIAGFINTNTGIIQDSYSNILIANSTDSSRVFLASGFVYENSGTIETSYSASQIQNSRFTQMNFSGVNENGELLANGTYKNCYFFNKAYLTSDETDDSTTETQYDTGAVLIPNPGEYINDFYGFAIANGENDGVWRITKEDKTIEGVEGVVTLIEPNTQSYSHRYTLRITDDSNYEGITGEDDEGKYILPYATLQFTDSTREIDTSLGGEFNPILIADAQDFVEVFGTSTSTYISDYFNDSAIWGTYRMVNDINLEELINEDNKIILPSASKAFAGRFYANGFEISSISIASENTENTDDNLISGVAYGLFKSLETRGSSTPIITNLTLNINQVVAGDVSMVGGLAGYMKDATVINITINFSEDASVTGLNFVGGLTGLAFGNMTIKNIVVSSPNVVAERFNVARDDAYFTTESLNNIRNEIKNNLNYNTTTNSSLITGNNGLSAYSYAGSVIGFIDAFSVEYKDFNINQAENYSVDNVRVSGEVYVQGQVAGGIFGLTSFQTHVKDAGITIDGTTAKNESHIIATKYFAGGVVGQSFGALSRIFATHNESTQLVIENGMGNYYKSESVSERGALDIFYLAGSEYTQKYVGGLIGYAGSGKLEISYSKLNVTSPTADFAGGIVGGMDLTNTSSYLAKVTDIFNTGTYTKYLMNEVYATGDVRARVTLNSQEANAGGIIGKLVGEGSRVALLSVNALNYFTTYDYATGTYATVDNNYNGSYEYKFNLLLGSAYRINKDGAEEMQALDENNYGSYLNIVQLITSSETGETQTTIPTVAYYQKYEFKSYSLNFNLFGPTGAKNWDSFYEDDLVYWVMPPKAFESSSIGHSYTQQAFLSSGAWKSVNWNHPTDDLFPSIRYQRTNSKIYLDCFNIEQVFGMMSSNSNIEVVVRGQAYQDDAETFDVIDLTGINFGTGDGAVQKITNFAGALTGSPKYVVNRDGSRYAGQRVRIITDEPFIASLAAGFYLDNVIIEYVGSDDTASIAIDGSNAGGLFSESGIREATISNLTIIANSGVTIAPSSNSEFGLIAPSITSSSIVNLKISSNLAGSSLLTIDGTNNNVPSSELSVGLVAGRLEQDSIVSVLQINGIELDLQKGADLISVANTKYTTYNIGGYFGKVTRGSSSLEARMNIDNIYYLPSDNSSVKQKITLAGSTGDEVNVGSFVGKNEGLNYLGVYEEEAINVNTEIIVSNSSKITTLNAGGIIGNSSSALNRVNLISNSVYDSGLYVQSGCSITDLNAGGFAGKSSGMLEISNLDTMNFEVAEYNTGGSSSDSGDKLDNNLQSKLNSNEFRDYLDDNDSKTYYDDKLQYAEDMVVISGNANVGVVVGLSEARFSFVGGSSKKTELNKNGESIRISTTSTKVENGINIGSVVGKTIATVTSTTNNQTSLSITGDITSKMQVVVVASNDNAVNVGGMVGWIVGNSSGDTNNLSRNTIGVQNNGAFNYNGAVYSNVANLSFGGMVGTVEFGNDQEQLSVYNSAFGGALKIFGSHSDEATVYVGGTIGNLKGSLKSNSAENTESDIVLMNNYNYGDVFVEYDNDSVSENRKLNKLDNGYVFGGLIGGISAGENGKNNGYNRITANNNYSLMTSHNSRYDASHGNRKVNALFGDMPSTVSFNNISNNYYSSSVTLCNDDFGTDIGYTRGYGKDLALGYNGSYTNGSSQIIYNTSGNDNAESMLSIFKNSTKIDMTGNNEQGQKLNPIPGVNTNNNPSFLTADNATKFHGMVYYVTPDSSADITEQVNVASKEESKANILENIAIIGDSREITYKVNVGDNEIAKSFIQELKGFSYVSGIVINVDIESEMTATTDSYFAGVANIMNENSTIFAVQTKGTIEIGGENPAHIGGLVACMNSGMIQDSSTALDIIYRAGKGTGTDPQGGVYGIAHMVKGEEITNKPNKLIINTYATGSITTYIDTNLYAFADVASYSIIRDCYTITKLDWNEYTASYSVPKGNISAFGTQTFQVNLYDSFYDKNALNIELEADEIGGENTTQNFFDNSFGDVDKSAKLNELDYDNSNFDYNFGYPTHKYGFMKLSSYALAGEEKADGDGYDSYVKSREYTRLPNNTTPEKYLFESESKEYYYIVPNAGVLSRLDDITTKEYQDLDDETQNATLADIKVTRFALWYDMDLSQTEYSNEEDDPNSKSWASLGIQTIIGAGEEAEEVNVQIIFDGREKTISNLNAPLFNDIGEDKASVSEKSVIKNLRLTDGTISNTGILARTIYNTKISNMTISGNITGTSDGVIDKKPEEETATYKVVGGLVNEAKNSTISTVTSLMKIDVSDEAAEVSIGGISGRISSTTINYSSNYGPINSSTSGGASSKYYVGGIVGSITGGQSNINYSYNATSVMAGYASSSALCTKSGMYYVGGIVGNSSASDLNIEGSYNSGAIKSGNKQNGKTTSDGNGTNGLSYAAGIIAYGTNVNITSCYNEGQIEALGSSPETEFRWENFIYTDKETSIGKIKYKEATAGNLVMYQTNHKNVYAYAIGELASGSITSSYGKDLSDDTIFMNGTMQELDDNKRYEIKSWNYLSEIKSQINIEGAQFGEQTGKARALEFFLWLIVREYHRTFRIESTMIEPENNTLADVNVNSYDSYGLPSSFSIKLQFKSSYNLDYWQWIQVQIIPVPSWGNVGSGDITNNDHAVLNDYNIYQTYEEGYSNYDAYVEGGNKSVIASWNGNDKISEIKSNTRSQKVGGEDDLTIKVANKEFYIANSNNLESLFNAGVWNYQIVADLDNLPYINGLDYYNITASGTNKSGQKVDLVVNKNSISYDEKTNKGNITFTCYSFEQLQGDIVYNIDFNYEDVLSFDTSKLKYYYYDEYSIGIEADNISLLSAIGGYYLKTPEGNLLTTGVIKAMIMDGNNSNVPVVGDEGDKFVYFAIDGNLLVYIPNATLVTPDEEILVNKGDIDEGKKLTDGDFSTNVKNIIDKRFNNKSYYVSIEVGGEPRQKSISFSNVSGSATSSSTTSNESTTNINAGNITYGVINKDWYNTNNISNLVYNNSIEIVLSNKYSFAENEQSYKIMQNSKEIAEYLSSGSWNILSVNNTIVYNGETFNYTLTTDTSGNLVFTITGINMNSVNTEAFMNQLVSSTLPSYTVTCGSNSGTLSNYVSMSSSNMINIVSGINKFEVSLTTGGNGETIIFNGNTPLLSYNGNVWQTNSTQTTVVINGHTFTLSIENNKLILTNTELIEIDISDINNFLSGLTSISNDFSNTLTLPDKYSNLQNQTKTLTVKDKNNRNIGTLSYNLVYNKAYSLYGNNRNLMLNGRTVSFGSSRTGLISKGTLNGVTIYQGSLKVSYNESYTISYTNIGIVIPKSIHNGEDVLTELSVKVNGSTFGTSNMQIMRSENSDINGTLSSIMNVTGGNSVLEFNIYSYYKLEVDDKETIQIGLQQEDSNMPQFVFKGIIDKDNGDTPVKMDTISYLYDDLWIDYSYFDSKNDYAGDETSQGYSFGYSFEYNDETFAEIKFEYDGENKNNITNVYYFAYFDSKGNRYDEENGDGEKAIIENPTDNTVIYIPVRTSTGSIKGQAVSLKTLAHKVGNYYVPYITFEKANTIVHLYKTGSGSNIENYLYLNDNYEFIQSLGEDDNEKTSYIEGINYTWGTRFMPSYETYSQTIDVNIDQLNKFDIQIATDSGNPIKNKHYLVDGNQYTIILNNKDAKFSNFNINIKVKEANSFKEDKDTEVTGNTQSAKEALPIILTTDISFVNKTEFLKNENVNIIGNGYYLSYFDSTLYNSIAGKGSFIKDIIFLGENYNKSLLFSGTKNSENSAYRFESELINCSIYGTISYFNSISGAIIDYGTYNGSKTEQTIELDVYTAITAPISNIKNSNKDKDKKNFEDITIFSDSINLSTLNYYGFISSANGKDGRPGNNGTSENNTTTNVTVGGDGTSGKDIIITRNNVGTINIAKGIIKPGNGGNGGAGGSSYRAKEDMDSLTYNAKPISAKEGGKAGGKGVIIIGSNNDNQHQSNLAKKGISGGYGTRGRYALSSFNLYDGGSTWGLLDASGIKMITIRNIGMTEESYGYGDLEKIVKDEDGRSMATYLQLSGYYATQYKYISYGEYSTYQTSSGTKLPNYEELLNAAQQ